MGTDKISIVLCLAAMLCSCGPSSTDGEIASLTRQCEQARAALKQTQEDYIRQNKELTAIMDELDALTGRTLTLERNLEGQADPMTQAEAIGRSIALLREKLDRVERDNAGAASLGGVVSGLKSMIRKQEEEIADLKRKISECRAVISDRDSTIRVRESTIQRQNDEIGEQGRQLSLVGGRRLTELYEASEELEALADDRSNILELKGKKNRRNGASYRVAVYEKALMLYEMASEGGYAPGTKKIQIVRNKIRELK